MSSANITLPPSLHNASTMPMMLHTFFKSASTPLPLRIIHGTQLVFSLACLLTTLVCLIKPSSRTSLIFALLSPWLLSSLTTNIILYLERRAAAKSALDNEKYTGLQLGKMTLAAFCYVIGFVIMGSVRLENATLSGFLRQYYDGGHREIRPLVWGSGVNWVLLWIGLLYGCIMPRKHFDGRIRLGDDVTIPLAAEEGGEETESDEALARALQAEEPGWEH